MLCAFAMHVGYMTLLPDIGKFELDPRQIMWMLCQNRLPQTNIFYTFDVANEITMAPFQ